MHCAPRTPRRFVYLRSHGPSIIGRIRHKDGIGSWHIGHGDLHGFAPIAPIKPNPADIPPPFPVRLTNEASARHHDGARLLRPLPMRPLPLREVRQRPRKQVLRSCAATALLLFESLQSPCRPAVPHRGLSVPSSPRLIAQDRHDPRCSCQNDSTTSKECVPLRHVLALGATLAARRAGRNSRSIS